METHDLKDGYVLSTKDGNSWQTFIESVLIKDDEKEAFLSTSCRVEFLNGQHPIFGHRYADVRVVKGWDADYFLRLGAGIHHPFRPALSKHLHFGEVQDQVEVSVSSRQRRKNVLTVEALHAELSEGPRDNWYFMSVKYQLDGHGYELICPCRYTNFSTAKHVGPDYIQPISGPVLVADSKGFQIAYVAVHLGFDGNVVAEIIKCVPTFIFDAKSGVGGKSIKFLQLLFAPIKQWLLIDEYTDVVEIDAEVEVFSYVK